MTFIPYISNRFNRNSGNDLADLLGWKAPVNAHVHPFRFHEDANNYYAQLDLPGVSKEAIQLQVEGDVLTLTAERKVGLGDAAETVAISRSLTLSEGIESGKIGAESHNGVLTLTFPKKEEQKPKQIKIQVG